jgi:hypothetical protein
MDFNWTVSLVLVPYVLTAANALVIFRVFRKLTADGLLQEEFLWPSARSVSQPRLSGQVFVTRVSDFDRDLVGPRSMSFIQLGPLTRASRR